jgi:hypothetical protein
MSTPASPPIFTHPRDIVAAVLKQSGQHEYLARAQAIAEADSEFARQVMQTNAYRHFWQEGVYPDVAVDICALFRALERVRAQMRAEYCVQHGTWNRGRPKNSYPLFQYCCYLLARHCIAWRKFHSLVHRGDRRQFYNQFTELAKLVYGREKLESESYCRTLKVVLRQTRQRPSNHKPRASREG